MRYLKNIFAILAMLVVLLSAVAATHTTPGPIGLWHLDTISESNTVIDSSGNGYSGYLINGPVLTDGILGNAFRLDGVNDRIRINYVAALEPTTLTVEAWVNQDQTVTTKQYIVGNADEFQSIGYGLRLDASGRPGFIMGRGFGTDGYENDIAVSATSIRDGQWHQVVGTFDGTVLRLYVDGVEKASVARTQALVPSGKEIYIGADSFFPYNSLFFAGVIDEVALYSRALSLAEVQNHYDSDNDAVLNYYDNCPTVANPTQADADGDGVGDACESSTTTPTDTDGDGVADPTDNCPTVANPTQADADGNGVGDACESNLSSDEQKFKTLEARFTNYDEEYDDLRDDYKNAIDDDEDEDEIEQAEEDLEDLQDDLDNLVEDLEDLEKQVKDRSVRDENLLDKIENLIDDTERLSERIDTLLGNEVRESSVYVPPTPAPTAPRPTTNPPPGVVYNLLPADIPTAPVVTAEQTNWGVIALLAGGVVIVAAMIIFFLALLLRR